MACVVVILLDGHDELVFDVVLCRQHRSVNPVPSTTRLHLQSM